MKRLAVTMMLLLAFATAHAQGFDDTAFDTLLRANVRDGVVNYPGFHNNPAFNAYIEALARPVQLGSKSAALTYYINAYNALAIAGIVDGLSPSTFLGRARYFKFKEWTLNGHAISLYDLEHRVIRPLGEPRIHFAIVCASKSCPFLRAEVYVAERLDSQLDDQARHFVNDTFRNRFDAPARVAHLSEIFKWFDEDFQGAGSMQRFIAKYVADPAVAKLLADDAFKIEWIDYDWNLNGIPPVR